MIKGVNIAFVVTGACYLLVSVTGFHAFGVGVSDDVLENFTKYPIPVAIANIMVVIHVGAAYQVYTHPVFDMIEVQMRKRTAGGAPVHPLLRAAYRIVYVALITLVAILIPFFGSLMGLVGALGISPTTFLLPCLLWALYKQPERFSWSWCLNLGLVIITGTIGVLGSVGAVYSITQAAQGYKVAV